MPHEADAASRTERLLSLAHVQEMTSLSGDQLLRMESREEFPLRIPLSQRRVAWAQSEVQAWIAKRKAMRDDDAKEGDLRRQRMPPGTRGRLQRELEDTS